MSSCQSSRQTADPLRLKRAPPKILHRTPIDRIPLEILGEVMLQYWASAAPPMQPPLDPAAVPDSSERTRPAVVLSHVCRGWRGAAINDGRLWSRIVVADADTAPGHIEKTKAYVQTYLFRSKASPLLLRLGGGSTLPFSQKILPMLIKHKQRWALLDCPIGFLQLQSFREASFPILETIHVQPGLHNSTDQLHPAFPYAPKLRRVITDDQVFISLLSQIPWSQLTSFVGPLQKWINDTEIIARLSSVTTLSLHCFTALTKTVSLQNVKSVELMFPGCHGETMCHSLDSFSFPSMTHLSIKGGFYGPIPRALHSILTNLLFRTNTNLVKLCLMDFPLTTLEMTQLLSMYPLSQLEELRLSFGDSILFDYLTIREKVEYPTLPRLTIFEVGGYFKKGDVKALLRMVNSRLVPTSLQKAVPSLPAALKDRSHSLSTNPGTPPYNTVSSSTPFLPPVRPPPIRRLSSLTIPYHGWCDIPLGDQEAFLAMEESGLEVIIGLSD